MPFVKVVKNKAYFKRYQTKYRRRREGKTDYYARKRLVTQAKNKYNSPKYRMVVRITGKNIICQIVYSKIQGDVVMCAAYAHELPSMGSSTGCVEPDGEYYEVEPVEDGPRPFRAFLDTGLRRSTTGSRIFGALKGAVDGGLSIPYSEDRFPAFSKSDKKCDTELLASYIYGGHVTEYMEYLIEEDDEAYKRQFATYIASGIEPGDLEDLYKEAHQKIRANPVAEKKERTPFTPEELAKLKSYKIQPRNLKQRKDRVAQKKAAFARAHSA
ncbi:hypothetical protein BSLG_000313 [Batrachochytrium salamandrivorans]|nr:hypothetical protein BSLG_000313 [Batrachochytrium salamandrivorans]